MFKPHTQVKAVIVLVCFFACVCVCAALLAPLFWHGGQWLLAHGHVAWLAPFPFFRYFNRALLITACVALVCVRKHVWSGHMRALWHRPFFSEMVQAVLGMVLAYAGLWSVHAGLVVLGWLKEVREPYPWLGVCVGAVAVACVEEVLFRGVLLGWLLKKTPREGALWIAACVFACVHFLGPSRHVGDVGVFSGFGVLAGLFERFMRVDVSTYTAFATLCVLGYVLGKAVCVQKHFWGAVGLHAGWVVAFKRVSSSTALVHAPDVWLGASLLEGLVPAALVGCTGLFFVYFCKRFAWGSKKT